MLQASKNTHSYQFSSDELPSTTRNEATILFYDIMNRHSFLDSKWKINLVYNVCGGVCVGAEERILGTCGFGRGGGVGIKWNERWGGAGRRVNYLLIFFPILQFRLSLLSTVRSTVFSRQILPRSSLRLPLLSLIYIPPQPTTSSNPAQSFSQRYKEKIEVKNEIPVCESL